MSTENRIDYIEIPARDPALAQRFFEALFGWQFEDYGPDYCSFNDGSLAGGFYRADSAAAVGRGSVLVVFYCGDLEQAVTRVRDAGGTIAKEIFAFPGGRRFHFLDPCGNEYAIWSER